MLNILERCVALEQCQDALLDEICDGPLISKDQLTSVAILPAPDYASKPMNPQPAPGTALF